ncbi:DUF1684 domain-containing protein [Pontibacter chinhatensis]|uniref:DUF1684 domain-containing protein n=1 Tax=Pontibacter chinhatensis TaxID=1436961 RepID=A0A1I2RY87_9BACT|nr:DUF1684 domain-containing protein [Pontibacter chinhatensis]SFG43577.1 hypothetical protein SAMN05421739_102515 [Pontibacter chinhatensis]
MKKYLIAATLASFILSSCSQTQTETETQSITAALEADSAYVAGIDAWHATRVENLQKEDGWLALAGLYWLEPGSNSFGSAESNKIVFPKTKIAAQAGSFILDGEVVKLQAGKTADITVNGEPVQQEAVVYTAAMEQPAVMRHGSLKWVVIKRGDKYGVRLWDAESEGLRTFEGLERYPVQPEWRLEARLEQPPLPKQIAITNVLGQTSQEPSPGAVVFTINGQEYRLDALEEGEELFIIFADKTNGTGTYGAGRYIYMPKPDASGKTYIDFNKAYTPPCAFTGYATCPLPPKQNILPIAVPAGEKSGESL